MQGDASAVTICMTIYNTPVSMIRRAVMGILSQTMPHWRLIMVNDGGRPECWRALDGITDKRIERIDHTDNLGTYARSGQVLDMCATKWWMPHDSDDYITSDRLAVLLEHASEGDDCVVGGYTDVKPNGRVTTMHPHVPPISPKDKNSAWIKHVTTWCGGLWSTSWLRGVGGIDPSYRTSYDSALQTLMVMYGKMKAVGHTGYFRTVRGDSLTQDPLTGYVSPYRSRVVSHLGSKIASIPQNPTLEQIARIMNTGGFVDMKTTTPVMFVANIISRDSAPELPAMLDSLAGVVDGLVMVDGGSTDDTVRIVKDWATANPSIRTIVETSPWPDDFAKQRNKCLDITRRAFGVSGEGCDTWVLMIDTDDVLSAFDKQYITETIREYGVESISVCMDNGDATFQATQLFRLTADVVWKNPIHEYIHSVGTRAILPHGKLTIRRGRAARHNIDPQRNVRIGRRFVEANPCDRRGRFYLARDLFECVDIPYMERMAEAEGHLRIYMWLPGNFIEQDRMARVLLCRILWDTGRSDDARKVMHDSLLHDPSNRSAYEALRAMASTDDKPAWEALSQAVDGTCVLPYRSRLPQPRSK